METVKRLIAWVIIIAVIAFVCGAGISMLGLLTWLTVIGISLLCFVIAGLFMWAVLTVIN